MRSLKSSSHHTQTPSSSRSSPLCLPKPRWWWCYSTVDPSPSISCKTRYLLSWKRGIYQYPNSLSYLILPYPTLSHQIPAILEAWFPGEYGGTAVAEALFGDINPGGKLPLTFPRSVGQIEFGGPQKPGSQAGVFVCVCVCMCVCVFV